jgi:hypothetical protein
VGAMSRDKLADVLLAIALGVAMACVLFFNL